MSRLGKRPVKIDSKLKVDVKDSLITIKGPNGELSYKIPEQVKLNVADGEIAVTADYETKDGRMFGGTARSIINSMAIGCSEGFTKVLDLVGVGYRAQVKGQNLTLNLGYSHPVEYALPGVVACKVDQNTKITLSSCDKQVLGQVCAEIRKYRPPEPYKGKGILFEGEVIRRKAGKTGKK